jgi:hypothetical protein
MDFKLELAKLEASVDFVDWIEERTWDEAWEECPRGDWLLFLAKNNKIHSRIRCQNLEMECKLIGCWCLDKLLKFIPEEENRPLRGLITTELFISGIEVKEVLYRAYTNVLFSQYDLAEANNFFAWISAVAIGNFIGEEFNYHKAAESVCWIIGQNAISSIERKEEYAPHLIENIVKAYSDKEAKNQADYIRNLFLWRK